MNYLDIILAIFLLIALYRGFKNGLLIELASLIALIAGVYGAIHFSYYAIDFLNDKVEWEERTINLAAFALTFVVIVIVVSLLAQVLTKVASFAMLGIVNKLLGAAFGLLKSTFFISVLIMFVTALNDRYVLIDAQTQEESVIYPYVQPLAPMFLPNILKEVEDFNDKRDENGGY